MVRAKVYAILYDDDFVYVPIKAEVNPHTRSVAFLALMPNFFGGTRDLYDYRHRTPVVTARSSEAALIAEIKEESQGKYELKDDFTTSETYVTDLNCTAAGYSFYAINISPDNLKTNSATFHNNVCFLDKVGATNAEKEQCCIIRLPKTIFTGGTGAQRAQNMEDFCEDKRYSATSDAKCCSNRNGNDEFHGYNGKTESETKKAFAAFFHDWHAE